VPIARLAAAQAVLDGRTADRDRVRAARAAKKAPAKKAPAKKAPAKKAAAKKAPAKKAPARGGRRG
jgi:hypothetical protein